MSDPEASTAFQTLRSDLEYLPTDWYLASLEETESADELATHLRLLMKCPSNGPVQKAILVIRGLIEDKFDVNPDDLLVQLPDENKV